MPWFLHVYGSLRNRVWFGSSDRSLFCRQTGSFEEAYPFLPYERSCIRQQLEYLISHHHAAKVMWPVLPPSSDAWLTCFCSWRRDHPIRLQWWYEFPFSCHGVRCLALSGNAGAYWFKGHFGCGRFLWLWGLLPRAMVQRCLVSL